MKSFAHIVVAAALLGSACSEIPKEAYFDRADPESLLDVSSEVVNLSIGSAGSLDELSEWINQDQPSRAELYCLDADPSCAAAQEILDLYGVPSAYVPAADSVVSLVYERVLARDCENSYIDNHVNPYHLNHPTFGCSIAVNMVQMVSDKHQFVRPNLLDHSDARKAVKIYNEYLNPPENRDRSLENSVLDNARTQ